MVRAVFRAMCASWQYLAIYVAVLLIVIVVSLRTGNWFSLAAAPVVLVMVPLATLRGLTKQYRSLVPPGARLETEIRDATMVIRSAAANSEVLLSAINGLRSVGDHVVFHLAGSRAFNALPSTLFPEDEIARLRRPADHA